MRTLTLLYELEKNGDPGVLSGTVPNDPETAARVVAGVSADTHGLIAVRFHSLPGEATADVVAWVASFGVALSVHFGGSVVRMGLNGWTYIPRDSPNRPPAPLLSSRRFNAARSSLSAHTSN
jgi:hypothetical protein